MKHPAVANSILVAALILSLFSVNASAPDPETETPIAPAVLPAEAAASAAVFWTEAPLTLTPAIANSVITILSNDAFTAQYFGSGWWMGGGAFATARERPVGVIFRWESAGTGKRMCYEGTEPAIDARPCAWSNTSDNLVTSEYCTTTYVAGTTPVRSASWQATLAPRF